MNVYEMAVKYYPVLWDAGRLRRLVEAGRLSAEEYCYLTGEAFSTTGEEAQGNE